MKKKDTKFKPEQSGNPRGCPKGALNKTTLLAKALLEGEAESLMTLSGGGLKGGAALRAPFRRPKAG